MIRAILKNGQVKPLAPLPDNWRDGEELVIDHAPTVDDRDRKVEDWGNWMAELDELAAQVSPEDWKAFDETIQSHRREQKELMRREMGLD